MQLRSISKTEDAVFDLMATLDKKSEDDLSDNKNSSGRPIIRWSGYYSYIQI